MTMNTLYYEVGKNRDDGQQTKKRLIFIAGPQVR